MSESSSESVTDTDCVKIAIDKGVTDYMSQFTTDLRVPITQDGSVPAQYFAHLYVQLRAEIHELKLKVAAMEAAQSELGTHSTQDEDAKQRAAVQSVQALALRLCTELRQARIQAASGPSKLVLPR